MISEAIRSKYTIPSRTLFEITTAEPHDIPPDDVLLGGGTSIVGSVDRKWIPCATCARPREVWCRRFEWELKPDVEYAGEKRLSEKTIFDLYPCFCWDLADALEYHENDMKANRKDRDDRAGRLVRIDTEISQFLREESIISLTARAKLEELRDIANGAKKDPNAV